MVKAVARQAKDAGSIPASATFRTYIFLAYLFTGLLENNQGILVISNQEIRLPEKYSSNFARLIYLLVLVEW